MDNNYEAQSLIIKQRLDALREQAAVERLLRKSRPARSELLMQLFARLFRRSGQRKGEKRPQQAPSTKPAIAGHVKR